MPSPSRIRFNKTSLENLSPPTRGKRATYYDTDVLGLQLRITDRGVKSFCVFRRSKRGSPERITIGRFPSLSVEQARTKAKRYLADLGEGISVSARLRNESLVGKTLDDIHREYLGSRGVSIVTVKRKDGKIVERPEIAPNAKLKFFTARDYVKIMNRQFADWRPKPIVAITRDMVEARHREYTVLSPAEANRAMRYLRALFVFASDYRDSNGAAIIPDNPVRRLSAKRLWNRIERRTRYVEPEQLADWWNAVQSLKNKPQYPRREVLRDYLLLLLFTGLRRNEALCLRWEKVNLSRGTLCAVDTKESIGSRPADGSPPLGAHAQAASSNRQRLGVRKSAHGQANHGSPSSDCECRGQERRSVLSARPTTDLRLDREPARRSFELLHDEAAAESPHQRRHTGLYPIRSGTAPRRDAGCRRFCAEERRARAPRNRHNLKRISDAPASRAACCSRLTHPFVSRDWHGIAKLA